MLDSIKLYQPDIEIKDPQNWLKPLYSQPHSDGTSAAIYRISNKLCPVSFNLEMISDLMQGLTLHKNSTLRNQGKMGLFNLGAICYINSTIQQLFMIRPFREAILSISVDVSPESYFYQFQYMLYQLSFGRREFFIPE